MNTLQKLISEQLNLLNESYYDVDYNLFEYQNKLKSEIYQGYLNNNPYLAKRIPWKVVPAPRLKKIWEDYIRTGIVRDEKGIDMISGIMIANALKLEILTFDSEEDYEEAWGEYVDDFINRLIPPKYDDPDQTEIPFDNPELPHIRKTPKSIFTPNPNYEIKNVPFEKYIIEHKDYLNYNDLHHDLMEILKDNFFYEYIIDSEGTMLVSDYGTQPLAKLALELNRENNYEKKLVIIDKMLNITHQRSDLASWFISGGSAALSDISGYYSDEEYHWNQKSTISGVKKDRDKI